MHLKTYIIILFCVFFWKQSSAQITNKEIIAKIETQNVDDFINIKGTATNTLDVIKSLRYTMHILKTNKETLNKSKSIQSGLFTLLPNERKELSQSTVNQNEKDKVIVILLIYDDEDVLLGKDRLVVLNDDELKKNNKKEQVLDDGIEIVGIVTEDTKTKPGRDFYEAFYSKYNLNQIKGNRVVKIEEKLSLGRNTIVQINIDDTLIHEFFLNPNQEYIEQMSNVSIRKVFKYFQDLKKNKNYISQY